MAEPCRPPLLLCVDSQAEEPEQGHELWQWTGETQLAPQATRKGPEDFSCPRPQVTLLSRDPHPQ